MSTWTFVLFSLAFVFFFPKVCVGLICLYIYKDKMKRRKAKKVGHHITTT